VFAVAAALKARAFQIAIATTNEKVGPRPT